ncbi:unnamed protein product [Schistocephalus solidus]|uniref:Pecanex-like protein n=1 Tax=Schistocephalus solidus TaxID=70667 RepID=A0A183SDW0_SCHSO|nr:unnamed protein product [Schistocephalus solidus]
MTESLTNSGLFLSRENISGGACDSLNSGSRVSMKTNSLNSNELFSCGENNAPSNNYSKKAQLMRSRADNLVRNVIMRQMSNALEEAQDSPRRRFGLFKDHKQLVKLEGDNGPLKNLISGNYDAFSNCYRTRNNSETLRRKTLCDIYSAQKIKRQAISLDNDDSDSVINDAIATESDGTNSRDQHQLLLPRLEPVPSIDAQEDEVFGENDVIHSETSEVSCETNPAPPTTVGTVEPCPPTSRPQILINSHVFHSKVLIGESRSTEVLQPRNEKHEDVRQETAVLRRNSCTKAADCLLSPEPFSGWSQTLVLKGIITSTFFLHTVREFSIFNTIVPDIFSITLLSLIIQSTEIPLQCELSVNHGHWQSHCNVCHPSIRFIYIGSLVVVPVYLVITNLTISEMRCTECSGLLSTVSALLTLERDRELFLGSHLLPILSFNPNYGMDLLATFYQTGRILPILSMLLWSPLNSSSLCYSKCLAPWLFVKWTAYIAAPVAWFSFNDWFPGTGSLL